MKFQVTPLKLWMSILFLLGTMTIATAQKVDIDIEQIREKCKNLPYENRVRLSVARFDITTPDARGEFGGELATMLTSALQQVNCFRVLESIINLSDMAGEIAFGQTGYTNSSSSPQSGQMLGAQAILTGEVTEFYEGAGSAGAFGIKVTSNKARIGFIIKVVNPQTREVIFSRSVEAEGRKPGGFSGVKVFGIEMAGGNKSNTAIGDAVERGIIKAVQILAEEKDNIPFPAPNSGVAVNKTWNASNCSILKSGNVPSIMIIIPETHISRPLPDPAGETEMINKFVRSGFKVIDPAMYAAIRKGARFDAALKDPAKAASIGAEFGADVVIIGEGFSELVGKDNSGMYSCRGRIEARAIQVSNAQILMANGLHAGATEISESGASKSSLRNAGGLVASDFLEQFCTNDIKIASSNGSTQSGLKTTVLKLVNTDFAKMKRLSDLLEANSSIKEVNRTSFSGSEAVLELKHEGSSDDILDIISSRGSSMCEITGFQANEIKLRIK